MCIAVVAACSCGGTSPSAPTLNIPFTKTPPLTWMNVAATAAVIVHEGRHIQVGGPPCDSKDYRVDDLGAFGVHDDYRVRVERHTTSDEFPAELRATLASDNCAMRHSAFCNDCCSGS